jgi:hypothetical protein
MIANATGIANAHRLFGSLHIPNAVRPLCSRMKLVFETANHTKRLVFGPTPLLSPALLDPTDNHPIPSAAASSNIDTSVPLTPATTHHHHHRLTRESEHLSSPLRRALLTA